MTTRPASLPHEFLAQRLRAAHRQVAAEWLKRIEALLTVGRNEIFPSDRLLDHIPELLDEIAAFLELPAGEGIAANTAVAAKAAQLGELRYQQQASVHQLSREYQVLSEVLEEFVEQEIERANTPIPAVDALRAMSRLLQAVRQLEQRTIDAFVTRYVDTIEKQTAQVRGFTRFVSHEIRQPLGVLHVLVKMLPARMGQADAPRLFQTLERNVARLGDVVNRLDRLTRLTPVSGNLPTEQEVHLSALVADVAGQLAEMAAARGVKISIDDDLPSLVIEPARMELVFVNLIANAVKYSDPAKPLRTVRVARGPSGTTIFIRDNGIGIPQDRLDNIFQQFVRVHADRDDELGAHGLGLGLAIVRECMDACGGTIAVESTEDVGTTFTLTFPDPGASPASPTS